ncbi:hypothetical protein ALC57_12250 [Trachymyrmex cornetzi]|uniref:Uncharacterized protein n=1 Tax=Trachymyrmex cornetzi TaxID=471704 RepID=A0A151J185_9HYME|nr:hypothetical protein ALC57_12250 [Trachymyrmex cornetzi]
MQALDKLGETNPVTLLWVSRHQGISGNERVNGQRWGQEWTGLNRPESENSVHHPCTCPLLACKRYRS